ncbi:MAG TPA: immunoglobulin domain-containing protein [Butyricimonas virosa]|uniref:Immunoglobulin domain-containing protein n=1 Tax=Butyricimonas virosa TaxID=544645 RepID=A0A921KYL9_9BACT|nr:immunoglobulin domain-containing protein [Butyricimonas virosa]
MKKLLLLVLVFVVLTGFSSKELEETSDRAIPVNMLLQSPSGLPPQVIAASPTSREVVVKEGDRAEFSIAYQSDTPVKITVKRQDGAPLEPNVACDKEGRVTIVSATMANAGIYIITVSNEAGSTSIIFSVYVAPIFDF